MRRLLPLLLPLSLLALVPASANAAPHFAGTSELTGTPGHITQGPDGNIWVTISNSSENNTLARIKPSGAVKEYAPAALVNPVDITTGPDNRLWLTRNGGVVEVPTSNPDNAQDHDIADINDPRGITGGPQGKLWTASGDKLISFEPDNPAGASVDTINGMAARDIVASGGKLWIADFGGQRIVRAKANGDTKNYNVGGGPQEACPGPDGSVAFGNPGTDPQTVGRIEKTGGAKTTKAAGDPFGCDFIGGKWYFAMFAKHQVGILSQNGGFKRFKDLPNNSGPRYAAAGKNGTLWVSLEGTAQDGTEVAKITGVG
jgi:streptogramin lyase